MQAEKAIRQMEVQKEQEKEIAAKETEMKDEKLKAVIEKHDEKIQEVIDEKLKEIVELPKDDPSSRQDALMVVNEFLDKASEKKLNLLEKKQEDEL